MYPNHPSNSIKSVQYTCQANSNSNTSIGFTFMNVLEILFPRSKISRRIVFPSTSGQDGLHYFTIFLSYGVQHSTGLLFRSS